MVMVLVLGWMSWSWSAPVKRVITGEIFWFKFTYVSSPETAVGDGFNVGVHRTLVASVILFAWVVMVLAPLRWVTAEMSRNQRRVFRSLGFLLGVFPLSAALVALVAIFRLILDMGITPRRLVGLGCATAGVLVIVAFLWLVLRFGRGAKAEPGAALNSGPAVPFGDSGVAEGPPSVS